MNCCIRQYVEFRMAILLTLFLLAGATLQLQAQLFPDQTRFQPSHTIRGRVARHCQSPSTGQPLE